MIASANLAVTSNARSCGRVHTRDSQCTHETVNARFWPWFDPFARQPSLGPFKLFPSRSAAECRRGGVWGLMPARPGRARLGMTLEPLLWLHCSIPGRCLLEYITGTQCVGVFMLGWVEGLATAPPHLRIPHVHHHTSSLPAFSLEGLVTCCLSLEGGYAGASPVY